MSYAFRQVPCQLNRFVSVTARAAQWRPPIGTCAPARTFNRTFAVSQTRFEKEEDEGTLRRPKQEGLDEKEQEARVKQNQVKRPWLREDADKPPAEQERDEKPESKGKLLTTPTRLLKLILPLPISVEKDQGNNKTEYGRSIGANQTIQPLALLIHPQQPLSYVERLIQAELPPVIEDGKEKIPNIYFRAEDSAKPDQRDSNKQAKKERDEKSKEEDKEHRPHVASYSGLGHEADVSKDTKDSDKNWVRWSSSTEMGDFIRDAARGREFAIEVEGYNLEMRVGVPSFNDRTYYLRLRLRRMSRQIDQLAKIKKECDELAHQTAHRLAQGGFALMAGWWGVVYYVTFITDYGWDLVEPVTYLVGLSTIMGGYLWFMYISKDLSYKAAMNITVSRRQNALYESKGFDMNRWEHLVHDANALRREIKTAAAEYDVDWDEMSDLGKKAVKQVLEKEKAKQGKTKDEEEEEAEEAEEEEEEEQARNEIKNSGKGGKKDD